MKLTNLGISIAIHGIGVMMMARIPQAAVEKSVPTVVRMDVRTPPPPPPPPVAEKIPSPTIEPKLVKKLTVKESKPDEAKPQEKPPEPPPKPKGFSVDMASTVVAGSGPEVSAIEGGGNMFADPNQNLPPAKKVTQAPPPASGQGVGRGRFEITKRPKFAIGESERTPPYPRSAKRLGIQGVVLLRVYIAEDGRVKRAKILKGIGAGCDEVARRHALEKWRFEPAMAGPNAVGMWITAPVRFVLER